MKPIHEASLRSGSNTRSASRLALLAVLVLTMASLARAAISEPDALVYGAIVIGSTPVTAARTDVLVEARRAAEGPAIATYRMGSQAAFGDFYALRLRLQSVLPLDDPAAFRVGDTVYLVASDATGAKSQGSFVINDRGEAQRVDLGQATGDSDQDGLPDAWETVWFGNLNRGPASVCPNGQTALANFVAGTDPNAAGSGFSLKVENSGELLQVSFTALRAAGLGYEGRQRFYSLEWSKDPFPPFTGIANFTNIMGDNQLVTLDLFRTSAPAFFRGRVWLQ